MKKSEVFNRIVSIASTLLSLTAFNGQKYDLICVLGAMKTRLTLLIEYLEQFKEEDKIDFSEFN